MGIKQIDLVSVSTIGPTTTSPPSKYRALSYSQASRSDTVSVTKDILPADASITSINYFGAPVSNAGTTATLTVTITNNTGTISTGTVNLLTAATTGSTQIAMSALPNLENIPLQGDLRVNAVYAETGTASTLGGPWNLEVNFVR